jgi:hypothetical protein
MNGPVSFRVALSVIFLLALGLSGCASGGVDMDEKSRVLGVENGVRVDAQFFGMTGSGRSATISVVYEIENQRPAPIAFADMVPVSSYDSESGTFAVIVGSEVPGSELLPRLIEIKPGERVSLSASARLVVDLIDSQVGGRPPRDIRLKVVYLEDVEPFRELIGIPEVAVRDPRRADELFMPWMEKTRSVTTNAVSLGAGSLRNGTPDRRITQP